MQKVSTCTSPLSSPIFASSSVSLFSLPCLLSPLPLSSPLPACSSCLRRSLPSLCLLLVVSWLLPVLSCFLVFPVGSSFPPPSLWASPLFRFSVLSFSVSPRSPFLLSLLPLSFPFSFFLCCPLCPLRCLLSLVSSSFPRHTCVTAHGMCKPPCDSSVSNCASSGTNNPAFRTVQSRIPKPVPQPQQSRLSLLKER